MSLSYSILNLCCNLIYIHRDCTSSFIGHSDEARLLLSKYEIGILPPEQRIYRNPAKNYEN